MLKKLVRRSFRSPGFAIAVMLLVASVVAVNTTTFSAIYALQWKALPYHEGDRLVELRADLTNFGVKVGLLESLYDLIREDQTTFTGAVGYSAVARPRNDDSGRPWTVQRITPEFTRVLGVTPALGRGFAENEAVSGREHVLILSDGAWRGRFGADPGALGRTIRLLDRDYTVIGVMPRGFAFPDTETDAWMPYVANATEQEHERTGNVGHFDVIARLAPGASVAQAQDRLAAMFVHADNLAGLRQAADLRADVRLWRERFTTGHWQALALLQLAAVLLLTVVTANLINLGFDRLLVRRDEFAVRRALGARERDVALAILADLAPPALGGLLLGLALVPGGIGLLRSRGLLPEGLPLTVGGDALTLLGALVVAVAPVAVTLLASVTMSMRNRAVISRRPSTRAGGVGRARGGMLVAQVALTTVLVGGAGLLLHGAMNLVREDPGFDADALLLTAIDLAGETRDGGFDPATQATPLRPVVLALREEIAALPGVERVAIADMVPFSGWEAATTFRVPGVEEELEARARRVGPGYFAAMGIPVLHGREFTEQGGEAGLSIIVDELFRRRWLSQVDPLTTTVHLIDGRGNPHAARVLGVVGTVKHENLAESPGLPTLYHYSPAPLPVFFLVTRVAGDPSAFAETVRRRLREVAPDAELLVHEPMSAAVAKTLVDRRALVEGVGLFAAATLALAGLGLYSLLSYAVRRRTAELGVRMALGATAPRILWLVLRQGGAQTALGVAIGLPLGMLLARLLADRLYKLAPEDPVTWTATTAVVVVVALFACWWPAHRATQVSPLTALKEE